MPSRSAVSMERSSSTVACSRSPGLYALQQGAGKPVAGSSDEGRRFDGFLQAQRRRERGDGFVVAAEQAEQHAPVAVEGSDADEPDDDQLARVGREPVGDHLGVLGGVQPGDELGGLSEGERPRRVVGPAGPAASEVAEGLGGAGVIAVLEAAASRRGVDRREVRADRPAGFHEREQLGGTALLVGNGSRQPEVGEQSGLVSGFRFEHPVGAGGHVAEAPVEQRREGNATVSCSEEGRVAGRLLAP